MTLPLTNAVLAERFDGHARRIDEAFERGTARMDRQDSVHKAEILALSVKLEAISKQLDDLTALKGKAQGWLGGVLFVVALFGGGVGAFIKTLLANGE
jgi:hypothetical protein